MQKIIRQGYPVAVTIPICSEILSSEARKKSRYKIFVVRLYRKQKN